MPTSDGTPTGRSQYSIGQRRAAAIAVRPGSGLTAWGHPTDESNGTSKTLSEQAWHRARSTPSASAHRRTAWSLPRPRTNPSSSRPV